MQVVDRFRLEGQVALVTGAAAGIGRAIAKTFALAGAAVVVTDRNEDGAAVVADDIRAAGGKAVGLPCDVTREADLEAAVAAAVDGFGKLTILVNNAGGGGPKPFDMPMSDFEWAYQLNVFSLFRLTQLAAPHMKAAGGGAVLNISSMAGENTNIRMASYSSSKAAVNHLTPNIAFDLGPMGIRVNCIAPGAIATEGMNQYPAEAAARFNNVNPMRRLGDGWDIAEGVVYLSAPSANFITGDVLTIDGGMRMWGTVWPAGVPEHFNVV